jgi:hypothetical protein
MNMNVSYRDYKGMENIIFIHFNIIPKYPSQILRVRFLAFSLCILLEYC